MGFQAWELGRNMDSGSESNGTLSDIEKVKKGKSSWKGAESIRLIEAWNSVLSTGQSESDWAFWELVLNAMLQYPRLTPNMASRKAEDLKKRMTARVR